MNTLESCSSGGCRIHHALVTRIDTLCHEIAPRFRREFGQLLVNLVGQGMQVAGQVALHHLVMDLHDPIVFGQRLVQQDELLLGGHLLEK